MNRTARRILVIFLIFTASFHIFSFSSCTQNTSVEELFFFRNEDISATVLIKCNGQDSSFSYRRTEGRSELKCLSPEELTELLFERENGETTVSIGDLSIPSPEPLALIPTICDTLFSLSPENICSVETEDSSNGELTTVALDGLTVALDSNGIPLYANGVINGVIFSAEIRDFAVIPANNQDQNSQK